jgi:anaerobic selenocysteine-containing dehydrogenase
MGVGQRAKPPEEALESRMIVLWGINAAATHINFMTLVREARQNGAKIAVVDPYRNATARKADRHYRILPGTDAALGMGIAHEVFRNGWENREYLDRFGEGVEEFRREAETFTPERTAAITGLSPGEVKEFARDYGTLSPVFIRIGLGLTRHLNGWNTTRLIGLLPALTGDWNRLGGGALLFTSGFFPLNKGTLSVKDRPEARTLNMIRLGEALTDWTDPPIKVLYVHTGNPAAVVPNQKKVLEGLSREDLFTAVHEQNMTETARYADLLLPATFMYEHDDYYSSYGQTTLQYGPKLCEPPGEAKSNLEVFSLLESALDLRPRRLDRSVDELMIPQLKNEKGSGNPLELTEVKTKGWVSLKLDGVLGRWEKKFPTPSGKARFVAPELKEKGFPEVATYIEAGLDLDRPFRLLTAPSVHLLNSTFSSIPTLEDKGGRRPGVLIHPADADRLGAVTGTRLKLWNDRGEIVLTARVTEDVSPGVLVSESIWRNDRTGGYGINVLTSDEPIPIGGTAAFHGCRVSAARDSTDL